MTRNVALVALSSLAWACADSARPLAPPLEAPMASALGDEVASAAFPGNRGISLVEAYVDGRSELSLQGVGHPSIVQWRHFEWAAPGRLNGVFYPTRLGPDSWYPDWPDIPDSENRDCNCFTRPVGHNLPIWPDPYDLGLQLRRGRGTVSLRYDFAHIISFNDNAFPGAEWYTVSIDTRFPLGVQPWPNQTPYVVSLSSQKYVSLALLSVGTDLLDDPASLTDFSLGDDRGMETGIALGAGGVPLIRIADVNGDTIDDAVVRFRVSGLVYHGDAAVGQTVLKVTARASGLGAGYYVRGDLPVTFVP